MKIISKMNPEGFDMYVDFDPGLLERDGQRFDDGVIPLIYHLENHAVAPEWVTGLDILIRITQTDLYPFGGVRVDTDHPKLPASIDDIVDLHSFDVQIEMSEKEKYKLLLEVLNLLS